jgi:hypothetical protein
MPINLQLLVRSSACIAFLYSLAQEAIHFACQQKQIWQLDTTNSLYVSFRISHYAASPMTKKKSSV